MMTRSDPALLLIGHGSRDPESVAEYHHLVERLVEQLGVVVQPCFLEFADPAIAEGFRLIVEDRGAKHVIALPLFLGPATHQKNDVAVTMNWARSQWSTVKFDYGTPIGTHYGIVSALAERVQAAIATSPHQISDSDTAVLLTGRGSHDPDSNSEVYKIARLLWEGRSYGWAETAFYSLTDPDLSGGIERCIRLGARRVVIAPYLLFGGRICKRIREQAQVAQMQHPDVELLTADHLSIHQSVVDAVGQRYREALEGIATMNCDICKYRHRVAGFESDYAMPQSSDHQHGWRGIEASTNHNSASGLDQILPPRYQGNEAISAAPMKAADLQFDSEGKVAWDEMWQGFCDLALAGGPSHRGTLLEPVNPETIVIRAAAYEQVLTEIERGIRLVTALTITRSAAPGWVGIQCTDETMAVWLLRAIIVENISVRREGVILYVPAGPDFRLDEEIRNVVTAIAKTYHYWIEHIAAASGSPQSGS